MVSDITIHKAFRIHKTIPGVPKKVERSIFVTLILKNVALKKISSDKTLSSEKNDTKIIEIG